MARYLLCYVCAPNERTRQTRERNTEIKCKRFVIGLANDPAQLTGPMQHWFEHQIESRAYSCDLCNEMIAPGAPAACSTYSRDQHYPPWEHYFITVCTSEQWQQLVKQLEGVKRRLK